MSNFSNKNAKYTRLSVVFIDFNKQDIPSWHVLQNKDKDATLFKKEVVQLIRSVIKITDDSSFVLKDPFDGINSIDELKNKQEFYEKFKTIISFVYHYARAELNIHTTVPDLLKTAEEFVADLNA